MTAPRLRLASATDDLATLVSACAEGEREAFEDLVRATMKRLYRLSLRLMGTQAEAEDVLQQAYLNVLGAVRGGEFNGQSAVETWLFRITTNAALDALRKRSRERGQLPRPIWEEAAASQQASAELRELAEELDQLPHDQRLALVLCELEGLSNSEAAVVMGCSVGAVEQRLVRARATLRERCDRE